MNDWNKLKLAALEGLLVGLILSPFLSIIIIKLIQQL